MLFVLLIGGGVGLIISQAEIQRNAVAATERADGSVCYSWQYQYPSVMIGGGKPWAPTWLVDCVGRDYFGHVVQR